MGQEIQFISPWRLAGVSKSTPVLLAFSGGADSSVLLRLLWEDSQKEGYPLLLAHVNHGIRGEESLRDRDFCQRTAEGYGLEICFADPDIPTLAKESGRSLEEEARMARYAFFQALMRERSIPLLATAHHADDNLETLLFRLARGTSPKGLCGIPPARAFEGIGFLTRPLLQATRAEILRYAEEKRLEYVTDSTNAELICSRNKLRHQVIPVLEELFAEPSKRATDLCERMRQDEDFLTDCTSRFLENWAESGYLIQVLNEAHPAIKIRALSAYVQKKTGVSPEQKHLKEMLSMAETGRNGMQYRLSGDWIAAVEQNSLRLIAFESGAFKPFSMAFSYGEFRLPDSKIRIRVKKMEENVKIHNLSTGAYIILKEQSGIINSALYWRSRREGDTLLMGGMTRRLRKLYNEKKIPLRLRERLPLLCDEQGILWAPFVGARDGASTEKDGVLISVDIE